jgi:molybdenum cofactor cytidylyltransferase
MPEAPIAAVILAAGLSTRLGRPKQNLVLNGETLLHRALRIASEGGLAPLIAVLHPHSGLDHNLQQQGAILALNPHPEQGIASSIRTGVAAAHALAAAGVVLMTCDQPALQPHHLRALAAHPDAPAGSAYAGKIGIPAYFPSSSFAALLTLEGDTGARGLLLNARSIPTEDLAFDIDTEADFTRAQTRFDSNPDPTPFP